MRIAGLALLGCFIACSAAAADLDGLAFRVGPPTVVRGPFADELDSPLTATLLPDGRLRVLTANAVTHAIDTPDLYSLRGERRAVLAPGEPGSASDCGRWINGLRRHDGRLYAFVHQEHACDYARGETHKSLGLAVSDDDGLTWTMLGDIVTGPEGTASGRITGEGDCSIVDGHDGYLYAYCLRNADWRTIVARAPSDDFAPGRWQKYFAGKWDEPALGGRADPIGAEGPGAAWLAPEAAVAAVTVDPWARGVRLSLSSDKAHFAGLPAPLLPIDAAEWQRPAASELIAYPALIDPVDGDNDVGDRFVLAYVYLPPGADFSSRYLVLHDVTVRPRTSGEPAAGVALSRWVGDGRYRTTSGPVTEPGYRRDETGSLGYLLTAPPADAGAVELAECVRDEAGGVAHLLADSDLCAARGFRRLRTAGWIYADERPGTMLLVRCLEPSGGTFASNDESCEGKGTLDARLGFILRD